LAAQAPGSISPPKGKELVEDEDPSEGESDPPPTTHVKAKHKRDPNTLGRDMYKSMDGSALMAIGMSYLFLFFWRLELNGNAGMLLQEYISDSLIPRIPIGWEEEMLKAQKGNAEGQEDEEVGGEIDGEGSGISKDVTSDDEMDDDSE
jgi:hypothetical protein